MRITLGSVVPTTMQYIILDGCSECIALIWKLDFFKTFICISQITSSFKKSIFPFKRTKRITINHLIEQPWHHTAASLSSFNPPNILFCTVIRVADSFIVAERGRYSLSNGGPQFGNLKRFPIGSHCNGLVRIPWGVIQLGYPLFPQVSIIWL